MFVLSSSDYKGLFGSLVQQLIQRVTGTDPQFDLPFDCIIIRIAWRVLIPILLRNDPGDNQQVPSPSVDVVVRLQGLYK